MKLKCIIVDDEPVARKLLEEYISDVDFLELTGKAENPVKASALLNGDVDLMFLDINMPKMSGIEFLRSSISLPSTIMTTAYSEYALEGFELNVLDYLVKPFAFDRFVKACNKAKDFYLLQQKAGQPDKEIVDYFFVKSNGIIEKVFFSELIWIEAKQNYIVLHTTEKKLIVYLTLKGVSAQLPEDMFLKIHKSTIRNLSKITSIEGNLVKLGNTSAMISQSLYDDVIKVILKDRMIKR